MKKYQFEGYDILAPFSIASNEPMFDSDSISLKKQRASQGVQRWELSFNIITRDPSSLMSAITDFDTVKTMTMPQLNDVNNRIGITTGGSSPVTINSTVTVAFSGGNKYFIDGSQNPPLGFYKGNTYIFDQSDSSNTNHPLRFRDSNNNSYSTGVTAVGTPGQAGAKVTFVVPQSAPSSLKYYCTIHGNNMGNNITVNAASGGTTINYPKGAFVTGSDDKVYMIKSDASSVVDSNLYPTPPSGLTYSTVDNATIRYYRDISNVKGITFTDGLIASPGTINIIEAL